MSSEQLVSDEVLSSSAASSGTFVDDGDCCVEADPNFPRLGCNVASIEECICSVIPECCIENWSMQCVGAVPRCGGCGLLTDDERAVVALLVDSDGDGLLDLDEILAGLNPNDASDGPDIDGDGIPNGEDDDVDGDGVLNAYDDDVDGDGLFNEDDDDIDGDGLLNHILDDDDDGDGIKNLIDNDDDANGFPDPEDFDDDDDDPDEDNDDPTEEERLKDYLEFFADNAFEKDDEPGVFTASEAALQLFLEHLDELSDAVRLCESDNDCGLDERCGLFSCVPDDLPVEQNDDDRDGLRNDLDIDANGDGDVDDNNDGTPDYLETLFADVREIIPNVFNDFTVVVEPDDPFLPIIMQGTVKPFDFVEIQIGDGDEGLESDDEEDEDDENSDEGDEITQTGDLDLTEDDEGAGLPIESDGGDDDDDGENNDNQP